MYICFENEKLNTTTTKEIGTMFTCNTVSCNEHHSLRVSIYTKKCILCRELSKQIVFRTQVSVRKKKKRKEKKSNEKHNLSYISYKRTKNNIYFFVHFF